MCNVGDTRTTDEELSTGRAHCPKPDAEIFLARVVGLFATGGWRVNAELTIRQLSGLRMRSAELQDPLRTIAYRSLGWIDIQAGSEKV